jgi:hypothetical protein
MHAKPTKGSAFGQSSNPLQLLRIASTLRAHDYDQSQNFAEWIIFSTVQVAVLIQQGVSFMRKHLVAFGLCLASSSVAQPSGPPTNQPTTQPASQPATQPASQPDSQPFDPDLAAEFAAELSGGSDSAPATPNTATGPSLVAKLLPDISVNGSVALSAFPNGPSDPDLRAHDPIDNGFTLQEIELAFTSIIDPFFRADIFYAVGLDEIELEEGYITTLVELPLDMQIRAGQMLTKFGRQNQQHLHSWIFNDLPLPNRRFFGGESFRDLALEATFPLPTDRLFSRGEFAPPFWTSELNFAFQQGTNDVSFGEKDYGGPFLDAAPSFLYTARLQNFFDLTETDGLTIGLNGALSANDTSSDPEARANQTLILGADVYYRHRPLRGFSYFTFTAEYFLRQAQLGDNAAAVVVEDAVYLQAVSRLNRNWELAFRFDAVGFVSQVNGEEDVFDDPESASARFQPRDELRVSGAVTYYTSEFFRLRLQGGYDQSQVLDENGVIQSQAFPEVILQANFVIGVHGAHSY